MQSSILEKFGNSVGTVADESRKTENIIKGESTMKKMYYNLKDLAGVDSGQNSNVQNYVVMFLIAIFALNGAFVSAANVTTTFQDGVDGYNGTRDLILTSFGNGEENYGGADAFEGNIRLKRSQKTDMILGFDNIFGSDGIPSDTTGNDIQNATVTLSVYNIKDHGDADIQAYIMEESWAEGTGTLAQNAPEDGAGCWQYKHYRSDGNYTADDYWGDSGSQKSARGGSTAGSINVSIGDMLDAWDYGGVVDHDHSKGDAPLGNVTLDITDAVKAWADGQENHGIYLFSTTQFAYLEGYTSEYETTDYRPQLDVEYVPEPSSLLLLGLGGLLLMKRRRRL